MSISIDEAIIFSMLDSLRVLSLDKGDYRAFYDKDDYSELDEDGIKVREIDGAYKVLECHRDSERVITVVPELNGAMIWAAIACRRLSGGIIDYDKSSLIRELYKTGDMNEALRQLDEMQGYWIEGDYERESLITIKKVPDKNSISYKGHLIVGDVGDVNMYSVLYNYCSLLRYITGFIERFREYFEKETVDEMITFFLKNRSFI